MSDRNKELELRAAFKHEPEEHFCQTCRFWDSERHLCRRYPPTQNSRWPTTSFNDWCGEWMSRDE